LKLDLPRKRKLIRDKRYSVKFVKNTNNEEAFIKMEYEQYYKFKVFDPF